MLKNRKLLTCFLTGAFLILISCEESSINSPAPEIESPLAIASQTKSSDNLQDRRTLEPGSTANFQDINAQLSDSELNIRLLHAETVTIEDGGATEAGQTIFANDRQKRLTSQWVPGDERRLADGNNLSYLVFEPFAPANWGTPDQLNGEPAIDASWDTWNEINENSNLNITKVPDTGLNPSAILGGEPFLADISEIGFLGPVFFEILLGPGSSSNVLGVTFTFIFIDEDGNPTDINNDGFADTALKEIWYNDGFLWTDAGSGGSAIDIETVALHENGHALGFGHFGKISITENNNKLHVSPRAVMNAVILGTQRNLLGTDQASYTSIYGNWPAD
ncbi:MAG: hypothetical protein WEA56_09655 [Balneolaceae bacterium]